jgi:aminopeptidase-like protein
MQEARPRRLTDGLDAARAGAEVYELAVQLFPLPRSLTGDGVRETLRLVGEVVPLEVTEVPTGTPIFDWTAPRE